MLKKDKELLNKLAAMLENCPDGIRHIADVEQEKFDNWSERTQESEKGEMTEELIDKLTEVADQLDDVVSSLQEAIDLAEEI